MTATYDLTVTASTRNNLLSIVPRAEKHAKSTRLIFCNVNWHHKRDNSSHSQVQQTRVREGTAGIGASKKTRIFEHVFQLLDLSSASEGCVRELRAFGVRLASNGFCVYALVLMHFVSYLCSN